MFSTPSRSAKWILVASVASAIVAAGVAYAAVPDANGVIHGCYTTSSGALRVIDTSAGGSCYSYETALSWSQSGASVKAFTGADTIVNQNGAPYLAETCPDGGIPISLWFNGGNVMNIAGAGSNAMEGLLYPNNDYTQPPVGISVTSNNLHAGTSGTYTLVCS